MKIYHFGKYVIPHEICTAQIQKIKTNKRAFDRIITRQKIILFLCHVIDHYFYLCLQVRNFLRRNFLPK